MPKKKFDYKDFANQLAEQSKELIPSEFQSDEKEYIFSKTLDFSLIAGEAISKENDFNDEQKEFITQIVAEWTFHKSIKLVRSKIPEAYWDGVLQKLAFTVFEVTQQACSRSIPKEDILSVVEHHAEKVYKECVEECSTEKKATPKEPQITNVPKKRNKCCDNCCNEEKDEPFILPAKVYLLIVTSFVLFLFTATCSHTGLPLIPFLIATICFILASWIAIVNEDVKCQLDKLEKTRQDMKDLVNPDRMYERLGVDVLMLQIGSNLLSITDPDQGGLVLPKLAALRENLTDELGYVIPNVRIMDSQVLEPNQYQISVRNKIVSVKTIDNNKSDEENAGDIINEIREIAIKHAHRVLSITDTKKYMILVDSQEPDLVNNIIPERIAVVDLQIILSTLVQQEISIKDIILVFELLNYYAKSESDPIILAEKLKNDLK